ncbi:cytochrome P450 [Astrocystis sublimbata]|nr:cytochrome P450 [Astrocystis sublimbata]
MLQTAVFAASVLLITYLYNKLRFKRFQQHGTLPQMYPSLLFGHLKSLDQTIKRGPPDRHPDLIFSEMLDDLGRPPLMYVDLRPVNRPMVLISDYHIAEQISRSSKEFPTSIPKTDLSYLLPLTGPTSILLAENDKWKTLRKRYNPAFAPQHLMTLLPCILDKTAQFIEHLNALATSGEEFPLVDLAINLTFDIIGAVVLDADLEAQTLDPSSQGELVRLYIELYSTYWDDKADWPWWTLPRREIKRWRLGRRIDSLLATIIRQKHTEHAAGLDTTSRRILSLTLGGIEDLTPTLLRETCDQVKTFLLAGHDTTSITLAWVFYLLSRTPRVLEKARREIDDILGPEVDPKLIQSKLSSSDGPDLVRKMIYTSAVIKETLRLYPPAATARYVKPGTGFTVNTSTGESHCLDGMIIYNCEGLIQRDPAVYGESASYFKPERWLDGAFEKSNPPGAWRPFERGPRGCIGQDFAMIELKVIVAATIRRFEFNKVGLGQLTLDEKKLPVLDDHGMAVARSEVYNTRQVNAKPVDGMRMRVSKASLRPETSTGNI